MAHDIYIPNRKLLTTVGPVAQWITRLTTDQKIPGSTPGRLEVFLLVHELHDENC